MLRTRHDDVNLAIRLFADDIALIAPDAQSVQRMRNVVHMWCNKWSLFVNKPPYTDNKPTATPSGEVIKIDTRAA